MIYYFYGSDSFSLLSEAAKTKADFLDRHPQANVEDVVVGPALEDQELLLKIDESFTQTGLFESASMLIIQDLSKSIKKYPKTEEYIVELLKKEQKEDKVLLIADTVSPDKRLKFFKALKKHAQVREFPIPEGAELKKWIGGKFISESFEIAPDALEKMMQLLGSNSDESLYDLWQVSSEIEKLMLYKWNEKKISFSDVELLIKPNVSENVFALTNLFADGTVVDAIKHLEQMIGQVPDTDLKNKVILIVGALASQIRSLLLVKSLNDKKPDEIAEKLGWKTGRVWINQKLAKKFDEKKLVQMLKDLRKIDRRLKTSEEPPKLLLQLFIQKAKVN